MRELSRRTYSEQPRAIYANYRIFKGKASLALNCIPPTFRKLPNQEHNTHSLAVDRPGVMLLEFVPAMGERKFDYDRKQLFALSAGECGEIVASTASGRGCSLIHDPSKFQGDGTISNKSNPDVKRVNVDPMDRGDGYFVSISSASTGKISVPVNTGEFVVMRQLLLSAIPHMLGFQASWNLTDLTPKEPAFGGGFSGGGGGRFSGGGGGGGDGGNSNYGKAGSSTLGYSGDKPVFNPFENQQSGKSTGTKDGTAKGSNWLDEL